MRDRGRGGVIKPGSQNARILEILDDGRWHTSAELHRRVMCVLHSRIAELNKHGRTEGFRVEHRGGGSGAENHEYRLVATPSDASPQGDRDRAVSALDASGASLASLGAAVAEADGQLPAEHAASTFEQLQLVAA